MYQIEVSWRRHETLRNSLPSSPGVPLGADLLTQGDTTEHWNCEFSEIVNDFGKSIRETPLPHFFHKCIPLDEMALCEVYCQHFKIVCWYFRLSTSQATQELLVPAGIDSHQRCHSGSSGQRLLRGDHRYGSAAYRFLNTLLVVAVAANDCRNAIAPRWRPPS